MKKFLFYDTCALLSELKSIFRQENDICISNVTINELESIKTSANKDPEVKFNARKMLHLLNEHEGEYEIIFYTEKIGKLGKQFMLPDTNDSKIILSAYSLFQKSDVTFITKDLACKEMAKMIGMKTKFLTDEVVEGYTGYKEITMNEKELSDFYTFRATDPNNYYEVLENQYLAIKTSDGEVADIYKWADGELAGVGYKNLVSTYFGTVKPMDNDPYQKMAIDSLISNKITMLEGSAGTGKSYLSFAFLFNQLDKHEIEKIIIFCNTVATKSSVRLGFYPGTKDEKLLDSQIGNLLASKLGGRMMVEKLILEEKLELLPMSDIRGYDTTGMRAGVYISEAQNLDIELMRLALQRIGEDSICIIDGDSNTQIDMPTYAGSNNGMKRVSEVFKDNHLFGKVKLQSIKRSEIAELAEKL